MLDYIKNETKRISRIERKKILEADAKKILNEYKEVVEELNAMSNMEIDLENVSEEIQELYNIQGKVSNEGQVVEQGRNLVILGLNYTAQGLLDIYRLPVEILVDQIDKFMKFVFDGILELEKGVMNLFKRS